MRRILGVALWLSISACASPTQFKGSAHVGGPEQCTKLCQGWGMELAGMVSSGEFADGCICQVKGKQVTLLDAGGATSSTASASGVVVQMRAEEAQRQAQ